MRRASAMGLASLITIALLALLALACRKDDAPSTVAAPTDVQRGVVAITRRGCANCHGEGLAGNDTALLDRVHAPNLTPDRATGIAFWTDDQIARAIREGFDPSGSPLCLQMPRFSKMSDHEVLGIIAYLRALPVVSHEVTESVCPPIRFAADSGADADADADADDAARDDPDTASDAAETP